MARQGLWVLVLVAAAIALMAAPRAMAKARPTAIAVVDIEKVFNSVAEKDAIQGELHSRMETYQTDLKKKQDEVTRMRDNLNVMSPANPAYAKMEDDLEEKAFELRGWQEWQQSVLLREQRLKQIHLYYKVTDAIGRVAKDNGDDLVLFKDTQADFSKVKTEDLSAAMLSRKVLYVSDDLDLTNQVIQLMDIEWNNNIGAASKPGIKPAAPPAPAH